DEIAGKRRDVGTGRRRGVRILSHIFPTNLVHTCVFSTGAGELQAKVPLDVCGVPRTYDFIQITEIESRQYTPVEVAPGPTVRNPGWGQWEGGFVLLP